VGVLQNWPSTSRGRLSHIGAPRLSYREARQGRRCLLGGRDRLAGRDSTFGDFYLGADADEAIGAR
jgi:hypothetical protein